MLRCSPAKVVLPVDEYHGAMAAEPLDGLWMGYMNGVPVLGTDRNIVDGFIALIQGDHKTAEENGFRDVLEALPDLRGKPLLQDPKTLVVSGNASDTAKAAVQKYIFEAVKNTGQASGKKTANKSVNQKYGEQLKSKLTEDFKELREELRRRGENVEGDREQLQRSKRGEHVFNNSLLKLYRSIMEEFIEENTRGTGTSVLTVVDHTGPKSTVHEAFNVDHPGERINMRESHRNNVRTWVAHFPDSPEFVYIPANNNLYAFMTSWLKKDEVAYMQLLHRGCNDKFYITGLKNKISGKIELMRQFRVYLDPQAACEWLRSNSAKVRDFFQTEEAVQEMLRHLDPLRTNDVRQWVDEVRAALSK